MKKFYQTIILAVVLAATSVAPGPLRAEAQGVLLTPEVEAAMTAQIRELTATLEGLKAQARAIQGGQTPAAPAPRVMTRRLTRRETAMLYQGLTALASVLTDLQNRLSSNQLSAAQRDAAFASLVAITTTFVGINRGLVEPARRELAESTRMPSAPTVAVMRQKAPRETATPAPLAMPQDRAVNETATAVSEETPAISVEDAGVDQEGMETASAASALQNRNVQAVIILVILFAAAGIWYTRSRSRKPTALQTVEASRESIEPM